MGCEVSKLQSKLRDISDLVRNYTPDYLPYIADGFELDMKGFSLSKLTFAVHKETDPIGFGVEQAEFMLYLGEEICPRILAMNDTGYVMEFLKPCELFVGSLRMQETFLQRVWKKSLEDAPFTKVFDDINWIIELADSIDVSVPLWAMEDQICLIHGDPTLDNSYITKEGHLRIADPIPPHRLKRPSIRAVDHGKILQSLLGWEVVLRGVPRVRFTMPNFMDDYDTARRAVFWAMVALKRIALRDVSTSAGQWARDIAVELEKCM